MQPMANLALRAARLAGQHIARAYDRPDLIKISDKGQNDFVTNVDVEAERIIIDSLRKKYPDHIFTGEENSQDEFVASRGNGCSVNGTRTRVRTTKNLDGAMISTGGGGMQDVAEAQGRVYTQLIEERAILRQPGSAALDLAYIASGKLDGMWMKNLQLWDMAAGALMVQESGGLLGDFSGGGNHLKSGNIIAAGPKVFKVLTPIVKKHLGAIK